MPFTPTTYSLASIARKKLDIEAGRGSYNLRVLVAHANILDELLTELNALVAEGHPTELYASDILPQIIALDRRAENVVVTVEEAGADDEEEEEGVNLALSPPLLSHDSDSESDLDESEEDDGFDMISPTSSAESNSSVEEDVEADIEPGLDLRRTNSVWRFLGCDPKVSDNRQSLNDEKSLGKVVDEFTRFVSSAISHANTQN